MRFFFSIAGFGTSVARLHILVEVLNQLSTLLNLDIFKLREILHCMDAGGQEVAALVFGHRVELWMKLWCQVKSLPFRL